MGSDQSIYLTEKDRVRVFRDTDGDGKSDEMQVLLQMTASATIYDHAGILGLTISPDNWLYVSRGNTGSQAWEITGTDGRKIEGYGDGGNVFRCRLDGSELEEVATGFWNPFDLTFSQEGRLLLVDNDPDSRGPNRLVEIVPGGNYGYQALYGGSGIHPYLAWNGELPGTLPYAAALGEAPSGLLDAGYSNLGMAYNESLLATIWEENSIVTLPLQLHQSTVKGEAKILVQGDSTFHPVALATNSRGEVYITDWVVRQYPNHGRGRLWRLTARTPQPFTPPTQDLISHTQHLTDVEACQQALKSADVFQQAAARYVLNKAPFGKIVWQWLEGDDPQLRLQALLTLFEFPKNIPRTQVVQLLNDEEEDIRRMALQYIGQRSYSMLEPALEEALTTGKITPPLMETYLATVRHVQPEFSIPYQQQSEPLSKKIPRKLPQNFIAELLQTPTLSPEIKAAILPYLEQPNAHQPMLLELLAEAPEPLAFGLVQRLRMVNHPEVAQAFWEISTDITFTDSLRAQALVGLSYQSADYCASMGTLLTSYSPEVAQVAARYMCRCQSDEEAKTVVARLVEEPASPNISAAVIDLLRSCQGAEPIDSEAPTPTPPGNANAGRYVFQLPHAQCINCHQIQGWGGKYGPDLSHVGSSKSRTLLMNAILEPSAEIAPEWQAWYVVDQEGKRHVGRQIDVKLKSVELGMPSGEFVNYPSPQGYGLATASLMPEGLEQGLTKQEFADLVAYLESLK